MDWSQISGARTIVEATLPEMNVELSQGSHFFHNLSSFRAIYFTVRHDGPLPIDWDWLNRQPVVSETELVRHVRPHNPVSVRVDGRTLAESFLRHRSKTRRGDAMNQDEARVSTILHDLQERAKELNCLYRVDELLNQRDAPLETVLRGIVEILPPGWQYPHDCQARILFNNQSIESANFQPTEWAQRADIVVQDETVGTVEVSYRTQMPRSDDGPFLKEERKLINTIADRIAATSCSVALKPPSQG